MNQALLISTVSRMLAAGKGLLAMDESNRTCDERFAAVGVAQTEENRRRYRELLLTTPRLGEVISGVILYDETIRQADTDGNPFVKLLETVGIVPGIKVDIGAKPLAGQPGETVTEGLDGLRDRLHAYFDMGARFAKWRAVVKIGEGLPSRACIIANAHALARYAALCQEAGIVPVVESDVLMEGDHFMSACREASAAALRQIFIELAAQDVDLEGMILKPGMILPGLDCALQPTPGQVAEATISLFREVVPAAVPGIAFLSGGQSGELATERLNAMNGIHRSPNVRLPWAVTFSFARAIQQPALEIWAGKDENRIAAQTALLHRARCDSAAREGRYTSAMETNAE